jgi:uncharacterized protein (DUF885 family)
MIRTALPALLAVLSPMPAEAAEADAPRAGEATPRADETKAEAVARIADETWQWVLGSDNGLRDAAGLPFNGIKDITLEEARRDADFANGRIAALRAIDPAMLSPDDEINRRFLLKFHEDVAQGPDNWITDFAITPYSGVLGLSGLLEFASKRPLATPAERAEYLHLITEIGDRLDQMLGRTIAQRDAGIYLPKPAIPSLRATYAALAIR